LDEGLRHCKFTFQIYVFNRVFHCTPLLVFEVIRADCIILKSVIQDHCLTLKPLLLKRRIVLRPLEAMKHCIILKPLKGRTISSVDIVVNFIFVMDIGGFILFGWKICATWFEGSNLILISIHNLIKRSIWGHFHYLPSFNWLPFIQGLLMLQNTFFVLFFKTLFVRVRPLYKNSYPVIYHL